MEKWFRRSMMALGFLYILLLGSLIASMVWLKLEETFELIGMGVLLFSILTILVAGVTGIGTFFQWIGNRSTEKAKRGVIYQDEMLNRIMQKLSAEERGYLEGYLNAQSYETIEGFDYTIDEKPKGDDE